MPLAAYPLSDAETLKLDGDGRIRGVGKKPIGFEEIEGQYIGLIKIRADQVPRLTTVYDAMDREARYQARIFGTCMTSFLQYLVDEGWRVKAVPVNNGWLETDTLEDFDLYHRLSRSGELDALCRLAAR